MNFLFKWYFFHGVHKRSYQFRAPAMMLIGDGTIAGKYLNICALSSNSNSLNKKIIKKIELNCRVLKLDLLYMTTWDIMLINTDTNMLIIRKAYAKFDSRKRSSIWEIRLVVR
jgi:hypothetical protein